MASIEETNFDLYTQLAQFWIYFHNDAINFNPAEVSPKAKVDEIIEILKTLPCEKCKNHALKYVKNHPIEADSSYELRNWFFNFHNHVNIYESGKRKMIPEEYVYKYWDELAKHNVMPCRSKEDYKMKLRRMSPFL